METANDRTINGEVLSASSAIYDLLHVNVLSRPPGATELGRTTVDVLATAGDLMIVGEIHTWQASHEEFGISEPHLLQLSAGARDAFTDATRVVSFGIVHPGVLPDHLEFDEGITLADFGAGMLGPGEVRQMDMNRITTEVDVEQEPAEHSTESDTLIHHLAEELNDPAWDFRTVGGLADSLGISPADVRRMIDANPRLVRWVPARGEGGQPLLTSAARPVTFRERLIQLRAFVAKSTY